jgi:hypothetical protein
MGAIKTYLLAPNFTYHPNTSICMGDIILDPADPTKPLSSLPLDTTTNDPTNPLYKTESHLDHDATFTRSKATHLQGSVFAKFLQTAHARLGGASGSDALDAYEIDRLETVYFRKQPTDAEGARRVREDPAVRAAVNSGGGVFGGKRAVYMVTGLKIARGFRVVSGRKRGVRGGGEVGVKGMGLGMGMDMMGGGVEVGAEVSAGREEDVQLALRAGQDIVFAYQLHVIAHKGWRRRAVDVGVYKPKAAFLSEDGEGSGVAGAGEEDRVEMMLAGEEGVLAFDDEMPMETSPAVDGDGMCVCIVFTDDV